MKFSNTLRAVALAAAAASLAPAVFAQTLLTAAPVSVTVTLAAKCRWNSVAPTGLTVAFGTYTAFQGSAQPGSTTPFTVECTRGFGTAPTITWDTGSNLGVVAGLQYSLSLTGATPTPGTVATPTVAGTGDTIVYTLGGSMPALQAGATGGGSDSRTLTLSF